MTAFYTLDENDFAVPIDKPTTLPVERRRVGDDTVNGVRVSTMFLGFDHSHEGGLPMLFETMIADQLFRRYSTWIEAEAGHAEALRSMLDRDLLRFSACR